MNNLEPGLGIDISFPDSRRICHHRDRWVRCVSARVNTSITQVQVTITESEKYKDNDSVLWKQGVRITPFLSCRNDSIRIVSKGEAVYIPVYCSCSLHSFWVVLCSALQQALGVGTAIPKCGEGDLPLCTPVRGCLCRECALSGLPGCPSNQYYAEIFKTFIAAVIVILSQGLI